MPLQLPRKQLITLASVPTKPRDAISSLFLELPLPQRCRASYGVLSVRSLIRLFSVARFILFLMSARQLLLNLTRLVRRANNGKNRHDLRQKTYVGSNFEWKKTTASLPSIIQVLQTR